MVATSETGRCFDDVGSVPRGKVGAEMVACSSFGLGLLEAVLVLDGND